MTAINPLTLSESIIRRVEQQKFSHSIPPMYLNRLLADIDKLHNLEPEDHIYSILGSIYSIIGDKAKAIQAHISAVECNSTALNLYNLGFTYEIFGELELATQYYSRARDVLEDNDLVGLEALTTKYAFLLDVKHTKSLLPKLEKLKRTIPFAESVEQVVDIFDSEEHMALFGFCVNKFIRQFINTRFVVGGRYTQIGDNKHIIFLIYCNDDDDLQKVAECNAQLSDFMLDFAENHCLDFDRFFVSCEVVQ